MSGHFLGTSYSDFGVNDNILSKGHYAEDRYKVAHMASHFPTPKGNIKQHLRRQDTNKQRFDVASTASLTGRR